ncbi:MAG: DUF3761 domain-containing protein [Sphingomicrobium sp.]
MNRLILAVALAAGCTLASSAPAYAAAAKNYDCSKPGNANKAACKNAAKAATTAAAKATPAKPAAKPAATKVASTTTTKTVTQKNYDCSKAGNKNKAVCKSAATTAAKPVAKQTTVATTTRHYDCTKPGNANKQECKVSTASKQTASKPVATSKPAAMAPARKIAASAPTSSENNNPAGAIAQCKDGLYSHAKGRTGACSRHGGVAKWL